MQSLTCLVVASLLAASVQTASARDGENWVVSWTGPVQGPYPVGNPSAQPDQKFAFPDPAAGARDQTFRLMVRPDLWGRQARIRLSNAFGTKPVTFDGVYVGLQWGSAALLRGSNRPVTFGGKSSVTVAPGNSVWSDPIALPFAKQPTTRRPPARGELPHRRRKRPDDLARQGADDLLRHRARRRRQGRVGGRGGIPLCDRVVVLPRCDRDGRARRTPLPSWRSAIPSPTAPPRP